MQIWGACLHKCNLICFIFRLTLGFGNIEKESGWRVTGGEGCWQNRPQMPQMGFQSVLIYLSPWGLRSVVICLCLGWHDRCPSCFRLCSHRSFHAYRIIHSSVNSLRLFLFLGQDLEDEKKKTGKAVVALILKSHLLLLCISHLPLALCVFIAFRRWK